MERLCTALARALVPLALFALTSCGSSGSVEEGFTFTLSSQSDKTGTILSNGRQTPIVFLSRDGFDLVVGDGPLNEAGWVFLEFDFEHLADLSPLTGATLRVYVNEIRGSPHAGGGPVVAEGIDLGPSLDPSDALSGTPIGVYAAYLVSEEREGWHEVSVGNTLLVARAEGYTRVGFVLHPVSGSAGEFDEDSYRFDGLDDPNPPELKLRFGGNVGP